MKRSISFLVLLTIFFSACSNLQIPPFPTASLSTESITLQPTKTPHISPTPIPTYQIEVTPILINATVQANATFEVLATQYSFIYPVPPRGCDDTTLSPDGRWAIVDWGRRLIDTKKKTYWDLTYFFDEYEKQFPKEPVDLRVSYWSKNGKYLFFSLCKLDDVSLNPIPVLYRLDLSTGEITNTHFGNVSAFSPDEQYIVYNDGDAIRLNQIEAGVEYFIDMSSCGCDQFGWFVWSPEEKRIAFTTMKKDPRGYGYLDQYSVYLINVEDLSIHPLIQKHAVFQGYYTFAWKEPNLITLKSYNGKNYAVFNLAENRIYLISFVTPTP